MTFGKENQVLIILFIHWCRVLFGPHTAFVLNCFEDHSFSVNVFMLTMQPGCCVPLDRQSKQ